MSIVHVSRQNILVSIAIGFMIALVVPGIIWAASLSIPGTVSAANPVPHDVGDAPNVSGGVAAGQAEELSWEEYEASVNATVACFIDAGLEMRTMPHLDASGLVLRYTIWLTDDDGENARIREVARSCEDQTQINSIERRRAEQIRPTEEQRAAAREAMADCLVDAGVPQDKVDVANLLDARQYAEGLTYPDCANQVARDYQIPSFGG